MTINRLIGILHNALHELQEDNTTSPGVRAICQRLLINHIAALEALRTIAPGIDSPANALRDPDADPE